MIEIGSQNLAFLKMNRNNPRLKAVTILRRRHKSFLLICLEAPIFGKFC